jgi:hypothetical protein
MFRPLSQVFVALRLKCTSAATPGVQKAIDNSGVRGGVSYGICNVAVPCICSYTNVRQQNVALSADIQARSLLLPLFHIWSSAG